MKLRRFFTITVIATLLCLLMGCKPRKTDLSNKVKILCTTFPQYDWTMNVIGENFNTTVLSMLVKNGIDMHSFQPSAADFVAIAACDLFIYTGGESEQWIRKTLEKPEYKNVRSICLMDVLNEKAAEKLLIEDESSEETEEELEYDEHVWLSIKNAVLFTQTITDTLIEMDPDNAENYRIHSETYIKELNDLDLEYQMTIESAPQKTIIVCDRFPFKYLTSDYNLAYFAAFSGCEAETEASFETVAFLSQQLDELKLKGIFKIDGSKDKLCQTVISNSHQALCNIQTLDSMQSTTLRDSYKEKTYISTMRENLDELRKALY